MTVLTSLNATPLGSRIDAGIDAAHARSMGRVDRIVGLNIEIIGLEAAIGDGIVIRRTDNSDLRCEVIAIKDGGLVCMPFGDLTGVRSGSPAEATQQATRYPRWQRPSWSSSRRTRQPH